MENKEQITERLVEVNGCGYKVYGLDGGLIGYKGNFSGEGFHYKDEDAIAKRAGVCYICEGAFLYDGDEGYETIIPCDAPNYVLYKFNDVKQEIADTWKRQYELTDPQLDYLSEVLLALAEWACISTYVTDFYQTIEDAIDDDVKGIFSEHQKDAVRNYETPRERTKRMAK